MSRVFLAEETRLSRQVLVEVLPPEMGAGVGGARFDANPELRPAVREVRDRLAQPAREPGA